MLTGVWVVYLIHRERERKCIAIDNEKTVGCLSEMG